MREFWKKWRWKIIAGVAGLVIIIGGVRLYQFLPTGMPDGEDYFLKIGERKLLPDEEGQWSYTRELYGHLEATGDTFAGWDKSQQNMWKYSIAFASYGMPSLALIIPEYKDMITWVTWTMVRKMKSKKVWMDWESFGFGKDPITYHNIMYKGHLNLMYGLYQLMSGRTTFEREFTWLTRQIVLELRDHHRQGLYEGTVCEPDQFFVQCNSIGLLSLHIYDKLYGTNYTKNEVKWVLDFIHRRMVDPKTGLYWMEYHPSHDTVERYLSGYTNAWCCMFLRPFEPEFNRKVYEKLKETFVVKIGPYAYAKESVNGGPSSLATLFVMWAAKEYGDVELFTKLRNGIDKQGGLYREPKIDAMVYKTINNKMYNPPLLAVKVHAGWDTLLSHDWGYKTPFKVPDITGMTWKDILPQEIHEDPNLLGDGF